MALAVAPLPEEPVTALQSHAESVETSPPSKAGTQASCIAVAKLSYVEGLLPMMPTTDPATEAFVSLQNQFGVGTIFANTLLLKPPPGTNVSDPEWLKGACAAMQDIASNVTADLAGGDTPYQMDASAFSGLMIQRGKCTGGLVEALEDAAKDLDPKFASIALKVEDRLLDMFANS